MVPHQERGAKKIAEEIVHRKSNHFPKMSPVSRKFYPKMMTSFKNVSSEYDKGFYTSDACIGCGLCSKLCSCNNITIESKKPVLHHKCVGCMSCVAYCPKKAIQFKAPDAYVQLDNIITRKLKLPDSRTRYHHPRVLPSELIAKRTTV